AAVEPGREPLDLPVRPARVRALVVAVLQNQPAGGRAPDMIDGLVERLEGGRRRGAHPRDHAKSRAARPGSLLAVVGGAPGDGRPVIGGPAGSRLSYLFEAGGRR